MFVSHSTRDIWKVRKVRNHLEYRGTEPLLFFLRALSSKPELRRLLRREIAKRNFFLLCDSRSARLSKWVQEEVNYVKGLSGKIYSEINLEWPWEQQKAELDRLTKRTTVYLSYARCDSKRVAKYVDYLWRADFAVLKNKTKPNDVSWERSISDTVRSVDDRGAVVVFISNSSLDYQRKPLVENEFQGAGGANQIVLMELEHIEALPWSMRDLTRVPYSPDIESNARRLVSKLGLEEPSLEPRRD